VKAECNPIQVIPRLHAIFSRYCDADPVVAPFYAAPVTSTAWQQTQIATPHREELAALLRSQNTQPLALGKIEKLRSGAQAVVSGQQVALFGGPLFTAFKAAGAIHRAAEATQAGNPTIPIFWLASEDHDFAEINHITLPTRSGLKRLTYAQAPAHTVPVGGVVFDETITALAEEAADLCGYSDFSDLLRRAYRPGATLASAFAELMAGIFATHGLVTLDPSTREAHRLGATVLRAAIEQATELNATLRERDRELAAAGLHSQVLVTERSSLLFLLEEATGARLALKHNPDGSWQGGSATYSSDELLAILAETPERISPSALLRPVFQDAILPTTLYLGGPAEVAYYAQSQVLFTRILGRTTPIQPRLSATIIEPAIAELLAKYQLQPEDLFATSNQDLAQRLAVRSIPAEGKQLIATAGSALDAELTTLTDWMGRISETLGQSAQNSASKMRYQMSRMRRLAANYVLEKETAIRRNATTLTEALYPHGDLQERLIGHGHFFARYGLELTDEIIREAGGNKPGHKFFTI
jgi:bacillithiol biosynthesis cysteine-adding enzyme BshC